MTTTQDGDGKPKVNIIDQNKTFRGVNSERVSILPGRELTVVLFLHSDCDYDPKGSLFKNEFIFIFLFCNSKKNEMLINQVYNTTFFMKNK